MHSFVKIFLQTVLVIILSTQLCSGAPQDEGKPAAYHDGFSIELHLDREVPEGQAERPVLPVRPQRDPPRIFVGTSAYRDLACPETLFHAFQTAKHPEKLFLGVVDQVDYGDEDCEMGYCRLWHEKLNDTSVCPYFQHIKLTRLPSKDAKGPTKARHFQGDLIDHQDFCMQVDSHTMFTSDWDVKMVEMWYMTQNENAVLTTYLPGAENYGKENMAGRAEVPHICNLMWSSSGVLRNSIAAAAANLPRPKLTTIWAAGLSFSKCHAELATPYDPNLPQTFDGEEISKAARLFTHGYDLYTPHLNYIWHIYKRRRRGEWYADASRMTNVQSVEILDPEESVDVGKKFESDKERSHKRLQTLFQMPGGSGEDLGEYGLGEKRTLHQFLEFIGVNLTTHEIHGGKCGDLTWVPWVKESPPPPPFVEKEKVEIRGQSAEVIEDIKDSKFEYPLEKTVMKMALRGEEDPVENTFIGMSQEDPAVVHEKMVFVQNLGTFLVIAILFAIAGIASVLYYREKFGIVRAQKRLSAASKAKESTRSYNA